MAENGSPNADGRDGDGGRERAREAGAEGSARAGVGGRGGGGGGGGKRNAREESDGDEMMNCREQRKGGRREGDGKRLEYD